MRPFLFDILNWPLKTCQYESEYEIRENLSIFSIVLTYFLIGNVCVHQKVQSHYKAPASASDPEQSTGTHICGFVLCPSSHFHPFQPNFSTHLISFSTHVVTLLRMGFTDVTLKKNQIEGLGRPCLVQVCWRRYSNIIPSLTVAFW